MNCSMPGFPVFHYLLEFAQTRPLSQRYHPTISSSVSPFSSCPQSFPASGSFPVSQLCTLGGQSIRASASASVLPMNIQSWLLLGSTNLISFQSKELSIVFSSTTVWKHQFLNAQPSFLPNSGSVVKNLLTMQEAWVQPLSWEDLPEKGMATHSCLENPMDRGARRATVHGITKSQTRLSD